MDSFLDAKLLLERAKRHRREFDKASGPEGLWSFSVVDRTAEGCRYRLRFHSERIPALKPIIGDIANNLRVEKGAADEAPARGAGDIEEGLCSRQGEPRVFSDLSRSARGTALWSQTFDIQWVVGNKRRIAPSH